MFKVLDARSNQKSIMVGAGGVPGLSSLKGDLMQVNWPLVGPKVEGVHRVALMVEIDLTQSQFPGGRLEVSHLCHEKLCVNPVHFVLEPHARNREGAEVQKQEFS